jgi:hypothetical protein
MNTKKYSALFNPGSITFIAKFNMPAIYRIIPIVIVRRNVPAKPGAKSLLLNGMSRLESRALHVANHIIMGGVS